ncbi:TIGR03087 family PEP-CTERM/XrtA system glycosyltransferase [Pontixanthobacter gangjinensis]|uniref:TIGR03087 family PEP-CTERM/XrtA system glycosyltransferase n=2 Tax=Pontixanthobacter gangjinensis TaxID=1028742 RepID=A0A6I4SLV1_9SPHN|nr:TIGR03087 family PEP-CTERM/XrtA system glycosyltransferase [Pontixanthobacter gangjinensis]
MGDILFLAHRMPFPPDRGDKIRSYNLLKALTDLAPVHVGCFGDTPGDFEHESELAAVCASYALLPRKKSMVRAGAEAVLSGKPVSLTAFEDVKLAHWVERTITEKNIQTIFVFSGQMGQYVPADFHGRVIVDLCDVDSAKFEAYAKDGSAPRSWIDAREGKLLASVEDRLAQRADHTLLVSDAEADLFRSRVKNTLTCNISVVRNGIDTIFFDPQNIVPQGEFAANNGPNLVFTGQMDYAPNIAAAERVMDRLLPKIRDRFPGAIFHLVGRAPVARLTRRDGEPGIRVWGEVPDVRPFLAAADLVVAPLEIARGVQNKVLEAMAMARPVLLSPEAATGIDATDGKHFAIGCDDADLILKAVALLGDGPASLIMAAAARRYVSEHQGWSAMLRPLVEICGYDASEADRNAA